MINNTFDQIKELSDTAAELTSSNLAVQNLIKKHFRNYASLLLAVGDKKELEEALREFKKVRNQ